MDADFFNNAVTLLPVMMLTKVVDRHRRQSLNPEVQRVRVHQAFLLAASAGVVIAFIGAASSTTRHWAIWWLVGLLVLSAVLFLWEILPQP